MKQSLTPHRHRNRLLSSLLACLFSLILTMGMGLFPALATGIYDLPSLGAGASTWIVDQADTISLASENKVAGQLKKLAQKTGNEVRIVVVRRLDYGETIDTFADSLFDLWYSTPQDKANQTLLVLDTLTHSATIRTGEKIKQVIGDEIAESIITETIAVPLKYGEKYNQAVSDAANRIVAVLSGEPDPGPPQVQEINIESTFTSAEETDDRSASIWVIVVLVVATIIPMVTYFWYVGFPGR